MPRHKCDQLERRDAGGHTYYEVRAEETCGNRGGTVPMFTSGSWARRIVVEAKSHWMIDNTGKPVYADGTGPGTAGYPPIGNRRFPELRKWALVACWAQFEGNDIAPITNWFYVGLGGTFDVPIPSVIIPTPGQGSYDYSPKVCLLYACNDDAFFDNAGWLHVYEHYQR